MTNWEVLLVRQMLPGCLPRKLELVSTEGELQDAIWQRKGAGKGWDSLQGCFPSLSCSLLGPAWHKSFSSEALMLLQGPLQTWPFGEQHSLALLSPTPLLAAHSEPSVVSLAVSFGICVPAWTSGSTLVDPQGDHLCPPFACVPLLKKKWK
jgi:hypothetical protein